jgi:hypothetical protein
MEDYGEIGLKQIVNGRDFWCLMDELYNDKSCFTHNKNTILEAYKDGNLFGLTVNETDKMYKRGAATDDIFCLNSFYLLPIFCVKEDNKAIIIWTHTRARKNGFAKKLVHLLNIKYAFNPLPNSLIFWEKCNIELL